jgi:sugar O-acyltransferase (sialic acid O-acetyltransferase NeuD family)
MNKLSLILIGAGSHARSCIDVIEQQGQYQVAGLVGLPEQKHIQQLGYAVFAFDGELDELAKSYQYALVSIGHIQTAENRIRLYNEATQRGFQFPVICAPTAYVSRHAKVGAGSIVMHGAIVNAGARVGNNCIINTGAVIEHDSIVDDHCHISTGAILNGGVSIGTGSFVGSGCVVKEGVTIGKNCVVGMGLSIRHKLGDYSRFTGHEKK